MMAVRAGAQTGAFDHARLKIIPLRRERVDVRRPGQRIPVAAHVGSVILAGEPEDIGPVGRGERGQGTGEGKEAEGKLHRGNGQLRG